MLCLTCKRVRPARSPAEYTVLRAYSITLHGLCTCVRPASWPPGPDTPDPDTPDPGAPDPATEPGDVREIRS